MGWQCLSSARMANAYDLKSSVCADFYMVQRNFQIIWVGSKSNLQLITAIIELWATVSWSQVEFVSVSDRNCPTWDSVTEPKSYIIDVTQDCLNSVLSSSMNTWIPFIALGKQSTWKCFITDGNNVTDHDTIMPHTSCMEVSYMHVLHLSVISITQLLCSTASNTRP